MFDYLVAHGRMKEKEARVKFRQVQNTIASPFLPNIFGIKAFVVLNMVKFYYVY